MKMDLCSTEVVKVYEMSSWNIVYLKTKSPMYPSVHSHKDLKKTEAKLIQLWVSITDF